MLQLTQGIHLLLPNPATWKLVALYHTREILSEYRFTSTNVFSHSDVEKVGGPAGQAAADEFAVENWQSHKLDSSPRRLQTLDPQTPTCIIHWQTS